jgi:hypothetical protein
VRTAGIICALVLAVTLGLGSAVAPARSARRPAVAPAPSLERGAAVLRRLPASVSLRGTVVLNPRGGAGLAAFIARVSDQDSSDYGQYLTPAGFGQRFGPTAATVQAVQAALRAGGLHVGNVSRSRLLIPFTGTAQDVHAAFGTSVARYRLRGGALALGTTSPIRLPAELTGSVAAVVGLDSVGAPRPLSVPHPTPSQIHHHRPAKSSSFAHPAGSPNACGAARNASVSSDGLTDDQIANAYGAFGLYGAGDRGAGQHIAIYENEPFLRSDIRTFDTCYFGAAAAAKMQRRLHVHAVDGGQPAGPGSGEASLDVEDVSAMAPGAAIDVYEGPYTGANPNDYDSLDEYAAIVDADRDRVITTSWGLCEQAVQRGQPGIQQAENLLFQQAAAQGQTVFTAAGDNGSDTCNSAETPAPVKGQDPLSIDDPSGQPYVVAVGGTAIDDASRQPPVEQIWNGGPRGGSGGGGISESWEMPSWQAAATVPGIVRPDGGVFRDAAAAQRRAGYPPGFCQSTVAGATAATACRLVPDVSAEGDAVTGSITVYSKSYAGTSFSHNGWTTTGGTSSSAPIWAAMLALINASPTCAAHRSTAAGVGFVSPQLYALASQPARYRASFHDVTMGNNDVDGLGGGRLFAAGAGYDLASGLGSPQLTGRGGTAGLAYYLCASARAARPVVSGVSPSSGSTAGGQRVTITGIGFGAGISAVQIGTRRVTSFQVLSPTSIVATLPSAQAAPLAPAPQDGAGPANLVVTTRGGASSATGPQATFDYLDAGTAGAVATVDAISPSGGLRTSPRPVTVLGSGFAGATEVTFGGDPASHISVARSGRQITVTPPALSPATVCGALPVTGPYAGETNANDVCQVAVRVLGPGGASGTAPIPAPHEGMVKTDVLGDVKLPSTCGCEGVTAPDEYDYVPAPRITSVSTSAGPAKLASEAGGTLITVRGVGLNPLVLDWANVGNARRAASVDTAYAYLSGTKMQIVTPPQRLTTTLRSIALSVRTLAGQSPVAQIAYAGIPRVTRVINPRSAITLSGLYGTSDLGGAPLRILGAGFSGQVSGAVRFSAVHQGESNGTDYRYQAQGSSVLDAFSVGQNPGLVNVKVCSVTGCSAPRASDRLWLYAPGDPDVTSVTPSSGPAAGGTHTSIRGVNLGCVMAVFFGVRPAKSISFGAGNEDCGATELTHATSPAGTAGSTVPLRLITLESYFVRNGRGVSRARFAYTS